MNLLFCRQLPKYYFQVYGEGNKYKIILIDCGAKHNIIRSLVNLNAEVHLVPWNYDYSEEKYDGLFISNGPGDPALAPEAVNNLRNVLNSDRPEPVCGICMGNQMVGLAAGGSSYKLPLGNRGQNQPVVNMVTGEAFITPQVRSFTLVLLFIPVSFSCGKFINLTLLESRLRNR